MKVSSTATGEVLTTSATVPPTVIPVPSVNTYGSATVPLPRLPEKVAATPEEVISRAPFQWCDASTVDGRPEAEGEVGDGDAHLGGERRARARRGAR